jgi:S1-C subfamily serine protease
LEKKDLKLRIALAIQLLGMTIAVATPPVLTATESFEIVQNLTPEEINLRAKQFTVRIDGASIGTGVIVSQSDTTYTVLTNWHVVENKGEYSVQTVDGRIYPVDYTTVRQLPNLDLAILQFERQQNYQLAQIGDSNSLVEGQNIYFAGYPGELRQEDNRYYRFFPVSLVGILPESTANGYALVYNGEAFPGMSGSPVLDNRGFLVGIHGETNIHALTGGTSNYGIPINSYQVAVSQIATPSNESSTQPTSESETTTPSNESSTQPTSESETTAPSNSEANPSVTVDTITEDNSTSAETSQNNIATETSANTEAGDSQDTNSADNTTTPLNSPTSSDSEEQALFKDVPVPNSNNSETDSTSPSELEQTPKLLSRTTGIDYTYLRDLLASQQWEQANRKTRHSIARIIDTAKRKNENSATETNAIADFACQDIRMIDRLWLQYSDNKFGFTPQQAIWQENQKNIGFTINAWRNFATKLGWKEGEINNGGGYLLYEQLTFDPQIAPQGHLPWWFAASDEQQNIIKAVFNRCSLQEDPENEATIDNLETETETKQNMQSR